MSQESETSGLTLGEVQVHISVVDDISESLPEIVEEGFKQREPREEEIRTEKKAEEESVLPTRQLKPMTLEESVAWTRVTRQVSQDETVSTAMKEFRERETEQRMAEAEEREDLSNIESKLEEAKQAVIDAVSSKIDELGDTIRTNTDALTSEIEKVRKEMEKRPAQVTTRVVKGRLQPREVLEERSARRPAPTSPSGLIRPTIETMMERREPTPPAIPEKRVSDEEPVKDLLNKLRERVEKSASAYPRQLFTPMELPKKAVTAESVPTYPIAKGVRVVLPGEEPTARKSGEEVEPGRYSVPIGQTRKRVETLYFGETEEMLKILQDILDVVRGNETKMMSIEEIAQKLHEKDPSEEDRFRQIFLGD